MKKAYTIKTVITRKTELTYYETGNSKKEIKQAVLHGGCIPEEEEIISEKETIQSITEEG